MDANQDYTPITETVLLKDVNNLVTKSDRCFKILISLGCSAAYENFFLNSAP